MPEPARLRFRFWGWLSGVALAKAGKAAYAAGDDHEAIHCMAAFHVGQSDRCTPEHYICTLDAPLITSARHGRGLLPDEERDQALATVIALADTPVAWRVEFCGDAVRSPSWLLTSEARTAQQYRASGHIVEPLYRAAGREADR